jgi:hypothetical protein
MRNFILIMTGLIIQYFPCFGYAEESNSWVNIDTKRYFHESLDKKMDVKFEVINSKGKAVEIVASATSKGNGFIVIGGLKLAIFDIHDDGKMYRNEVLDLYLKDLNDDSEDDLIISGIVMNTENEENPTVEEGVLFIYTFDVSGQVYKESFRSSSISISIK